MNRWLLPFALLVVGCSSSKSETASSSVASSSAVPTMSARTTATPSAPAPVVGASDSSSFACGSTRCEAGTETCCVAGTQSSCVKNAPPTSGDASNAIAAQRAACAKEMGEADVVDIARCDEAVDCGDVGACCHESMFHGEATVCVNVKKPGESPCGFEERCVEGSACRTPGAVCVDGVCAKEKVSCKKATCTGETSACCGDPPTCRTALACNDLWRYRCMHPSDCLPGQRCIQGERGTYCGAFVDETKQHPTVCDSTADCPRLAECPSPKCTPGDGIPFKYCSCN